MNTEVMDAEGTSRQQLLRKTAMQKRDHVESSEVYFFEHVAYGVVH